MPTRCLCPPGLRTCLRAALTSVRPPSTLPAAGSTNSTILGITDGASADPAQRLWSCATDMRLQGYLAGGAGDKVNSIVASCPACYSVPVAPPSPPVQASLVRLEKLHGGRPQSYLAAALIAPLVHFLPRRPPFCAPLRAAGAAPWSRSRSRPSRAPRRSGGRGAAQQAQERRPFRRLSGQRQDCGAGSAAGRRTQGDPDVKQ